MKTIILILTILTSISAFADDYRCIEFKSKNLGNLCKIEEFHDDLIPTTSGCLPNQFRCVTLSSCEIVKAFSVKKKEQDFCTRASEELPVCSISRLSRTQTAWNLYVGRKSYPYLGENKTPVSYTEYEEVVQVARNLARSGRCFYHEDEDLIN